MIVSVLELRLMRAKPESTISPRGNRERAVSLFS